MQLPRQGTKRRDHPWFARRRIHRFFRKVLQLFDVKAAGDRMKALGGDNPVPVAARATKKVDLAIDAFEECRAQFREQGRIVTGCCPKCSQKGSLMEGHWSQSMPDNG